MSMIDNNQNNIPDILEQEEYFTTGDVLTAETMNEILASIKKTYEILTQAPQLTYTNEPGYTSASDIKEWNIGDQMKLYVNFTSTVFGKVTVTVRQFENGQVTNSFKGQYDQGLIEIDLGKASSYHQYRYEVTAVDSNGREATDEDGKAKTLIFNQVIGGFEFATDFNKELSKYYFISNTELKITRIPYTFDYVGQEDAKDISKQIVYYIEGLNDKQSINISDKKGYIDINLVCPSSGFQTVVLEAQVYQKDVLAPIKTKKETYSVYFSSDENNIVLELQPTDISNLTTDSRLTLTYKVSWFKDWNNLSILLRGDLIKKQTNEIVPGKSIQQLVTTNNTFITYTINSFPYDASEENTVYNVYTILELTGINASNVILVNSPSILELNVTKGTGVTYVTEQIIANFSAQDYSNQSLDRNKWLPTQNNISTIGKQWYFDLQSCSFIDPKSESDKKDNDKWDNVGSGWKTLVDDDGNYLANYLHLKHNSYGVLRHIDTHEKINLAQYYKDGFSLELYFKANRAVNLNGYNMSCLSPNQRSGFCIIPTAIGALNDSSINTRASQVNNVSTSLDEEWIHVVFVATPGTTEYELDMTQVASLENYPIHVPALQLFINGVLVKMSPLDKAGFTENFLYLNTLQDVLNSGFESDTKIQTIRLYSAPLSAADIRKNYISCLNTQEEKELVEKRNAVANASLPKMTLKVRDDSPNGFDNIRQGITSYAINKFTRADKKRDPAIHTDPNFPGAGKVYVDCEMTFTDPALAQGSQQDVRSLVKVAVQGTSSLDYAVKNYKIVVYDENEDGSSAKNENYYPQRKYGEWKGDSTYTLKCDFMEHSHKNNTPTAMFYNKNLLTAILDEKNKDMWSPARRQGYNDAIDGFPIVLEYQDIGAKVPKYVGTFMFNTDKAGLDQGFELPIEENMADIDAEIEYYTDGYEAERIPQNDDKGNFLYYDVKIKGCGDKKTERVTGRTMPCISYEGGSNIDVSAATFVPFDVHEYAKNINPYLYNNDYSDKWEYYNATLEPRYNCFEDKDAALIFSPIEKATTWLNAIWPTDQLELSRQTIFDYSNFTEDNCKANNGTFNVEDGIIHLNCADNSTTATYNFSTPIDVAKQYTVLITADYEVEQNTTLEIELTDLDNNVMLHTFVSSLLPPDGKNERKLTLSFTTDQASQIGIKISTLGGHIKLTNFMMEQTGPDILSQDLPQFTSHELAKYKEQFQEYFSYEYCLAYYLQALTFTQADNIGKNAMFDVWWIPDADGKNGKWSKIYPRPYDMDSQMGLNNQGEDIVLPSAEINVLLSPDPNEKLQAIQHERFVNQYAITFSKLWILFGYLFRTEIQKQYNGLRQPVYDSDTKEIIRPSIYDVDYIKSKIEPYTTLAIGEAYYNADAISKYVLPHLDLTSDWRMISGNRQQRYYSYLKQRLDFLDGYFAIDATVNKKIKMRLLTSNTTGLQPFANAPTYLKHYVEGGESGIVYADPNTIPNIYWTIQGDNKNTYIYHAHTLTELGNLTALQIQELDFEYTEALQNLSIKNQQSLHSLNLSALPSLRTLVLSHCTSLGTLLLPTGKTALASLELTNLPKLAPTINLTDCGLISLKLDNLGSSLEADKQSISIQLTNTPIEALDLGPGAKVTQITLDNCYQITEFNDTNSDARKYIYLKELNLLNCPKLTSVQLPNAVASTIRIENCPNIETLDLSGSLQLKELDLTTLPNLKTLKLQGCSNLTKIVFPTQTNVTYLDVRNCSSLKTLYCKPVPNADTQTVDIPDDTFDFANFPTFDRSTNTNCYLGLSNTNPTYIKNLTYIGNTSQLFSGCHSLQLFTKVSITSTGAYADNCFHNCIKLHANSDEEDGGITFVNSNTVTSVQGAFAGCHSVGLDIPYRFALAHPQATNFNAYLSYSGNPSDINDEWTWPQSVEDYGFFSLPPSKGSTTRRSRPGAVSAQLFAFGNHHIKSIPNQFFDTVPAPAENESYHLKYAFAATDISSIELVKVLSPLIRAIKQEEDPSITTYSRFIDVIGLLYSCTQLTSIAPSSFTSSNWTQVPITDITAFMYGCSSWQNSSQLHGFLSGLPFLKIAKAAFTGSSLNTLVKNSNPDTPLFNNNLELENADAMFAECQFLQTIPSYLVPQTGGPYPLSSINGMFAKNAIADNNNKGYKRLHIETLSPNLFKNAQVKYIGQAALTRDDFNGINTSYTSPGGLFAGARIDGFAENLFTNANENNFATQLVNISGCFKNTTGFAEFPGTFSACSQLQNASSLFEGSSIQTLIQNLFSKDNNTLLTNVGNIFENSKLITLDQANIWDLPALIDAYDAFASCANLKGQINSIQFCSSQLTNCQFMFVNCISLGGLSGDQTIDPSNLPQAIHEKIFAACSNQLKDVSHMFRNCYSLYGYIPDGLFAENTRIQTVASMFKNCCSLVGKIPDLFTNTNNYKILTDLSNLFSGCSFLTNPTMPGNIQKRNLINANWLQHCPNITTISGIFRGVGNTYNIVNHRLAGGTTRGLTYNDPLNLRKISTIQENLNNSTDAIKLYPCFSQLQTLSSLNSTAPIQPLQLNLDTFYRRNNLIANASEAFAGLGRVYFVDESGAPNLTTFTNFLKEKPATGAAQPNTNLTKADGCFFGTWPVKQNADLTFSDLEGLKAADFPFYSSQIVNGQLTLRGCYTFVKGVDAASGDNCIPYKNTPFGGITDANIDTYVAQFIQPKTGLFAYNIGISNDISDNSSPIKSPPNSGDTANFSFGEDSSLGSHIYQYCGKDKVHGYWIP